MSRKVIRDRSQLAAAMSVACAITAGASLLQLSRLSIPPAVVPSVAGVATGIVLVGGGVNGWRHGLSVGDAARAAWRDTPLLVGNVAFLASVIVPGAGVARTIGASLALTGVAFSLAAHLLLPPPVFDKPSGSYSVGTKAFTTELPGGRRVMVQVRRRFRSRGPLPRSRAGLPLRRRGTPPPGLALRVRGYGRADPPRRARGRARSCSAP